MRTQFPRAPLRSGRSARFAPSSVTCSPSGLPAVEAVPANGARICCQVGAVRCCAGERIVSIRATVCLQSLRIGQLQVATRVSMPPEQVTVEV